MTLPSRFLVGLGPAVAAALHVQGAPQHFARTLPDHPAIPFNQTCTVGSYVFDANSSTLGLYCNTDDVRDFAYDWTLIDLDLCVANDNGVLVPGSNFSASCAACAITWRHVYLAPLTTTLTTTPHTWLTTTATRASTPRWDDLYLGCGACANNRGPAAGPTTPAATIALDKIVSNKNGTIRCHDLEGSTMNARPAATMMI